MMLLFRVRADLTEIEMADQITDESNEKASERIAFDYNIDHGGSAGGSLMLLPTSDGLHRDRHGGSRTE